MAAVPRIFDETARRIRRDRAAASGFRLLEAHVADAIMERIDALGLGGGAALVVNAGHGTLAARLRARSWDAVETDHGAAFARRAQSQPSDEVAVAASGAFDLVASPWGLDTVNDLPGALIVAKRALRPGGAFVAVCAGAPALPTLRSIMADAETGAANAVARLHPLLDVRAAGDLLSRAGFARPVADVETHTLAYRSFDALVADLRAAGSTNVLARRFPLRRDVLARAHATFAARADRDGRTLETMSLITMTGFAPR